MAGPGHPPQRLPPRAASALDLNDTLNTLSIADRRSSSSLNHHRPSPAPLGSRRTSLDHRSMTPSSLSPHSPRQGPTTPTLKKRASTASLVGSGSRRLSSAASSPLAAEAVKLVLEPQVLSAETTVVLHDTSYKHRYARPNTSLADLATIVERPERIPAAVMGVSVAQVRAGRERLSIRRTERAGKLTDPEVVLVHAHTPAPKGKSWPEELGVIAGAAAEKLRRGEVEVPKGFHQGDLYLCEGSQEDLEGCLGAVYDGVDLVFGEGDVLRSFVCIRPPGHHCAETQPSGFCWLNNVHIAIARAAKEHELTHAVILDFDLHHGDGSQAIAWSLNELTGTSSLKKTAGITVPSIGYFSLHDINSYPCEMGDFEKVRNASVNLRAHGQHIHNVHLESYSTVNEFWELYNSRYSSILAQAREFLATAASAPTGKKGRAFKAGVFLSAGFDASEHESPGMQRHKVHVPTAFFARFTSDAVALANDLAGGRVLSVLEGGYSDRALTSGVLAHILGMTCAPPEKAAYVPPSLSVSPRNQALRRDALVWDSEWWAAERLDELERYDRKMNPAKKEPEKPPRQTSFMSATAASRARRESPPDRRVSGGSSNGSPTAATAEPPPKPWEQQAWELSRHFIPEFEEARAIPALPKASRAKAERHSIAVPEEGRRMTLRDRKSRVPSGEMPPPPAPRDSSRRRTVVPESRPASRVSVAPPPADRAPRAAERAPSRAGGAATARTSRSTTPLPPTVTTTRAGRKPSTTSTATGRSSSAAPAPSRQSTPAAGATPKNESLKVPTTTANGTTSTAGATGPAGMDDLTAGMQRVRITYKNIDKDREAEAEVARLEREAAALQERLQAARAATGPTSSSIAAAVEVGVVDGAAENNDSSSTSELSSEQVSAGSSDAEHQQQHQPAKEKQYTEEEDRRAPDVDADVDIDVDTLMEENEDEPQRGRSPAPVPQQQQPPVPPTMGDAKDVSPQPSPPLQQQQQPQQQQNQTGDHTFRGGEIRFGNPFPPQQV